MSSLTPRPPARAAGRQSYVPSLLFSSFAPLPSCSSSPRPHRAPQVIWLLTCLSLPFLHLSPSLSARLHSAAPSLLTQESSPATPSRRTWLLATPRWWSNQRECRALTRLRGKVEDQEAAAETQQHAEKDVGEEPKDGEQEALTLR
eukprot:760340-Hanusia_phi.AAC.4